MLLQQQISASSYFEIGRDFRFNRLLRFAVRHTVILAFLALQNPH
jgi:hypothetical protein